MNKSNVSIWKKIITGKITSLNSHYWEYEFLNHPTTEDDYPHKGKGRRVIRGLLSYEKDTLLCFDEHKNPPLGRIEKLALFPVCSV